MLAQEGEAKAVCSACAWDQGNGERAPCEPLYCFTFLVTEIPHLCCAESPSLPEGKHLPGWTEVQSKRSLRFIVAENSVLWNQRGSGVNHYFWSCPACPASSAFSYCSIHLLGMLGISRQEVSAVANACCCPRRWVPRQEAGLFWPLGGRADLFCCCALFFLYAPINHFHSNETCEHAMCRTHYIKLVCVHLCVFKKNTAANSVKLLVLYFSNLLSPSGKTAAATK